MRESNLDKRIEPFVRKYSNRSNPMKNRTVPLRKLRVILIALPLFMPLWSTGAFAALGGDAASVQADSAHLRGTLRMTSAATYTLHEIQTPAGTVVREYVSPSGRVFAVAWHGQFPPDLRQLLGEHFATYQAAAQAPNGRARRGPLFVRQSNLVVQQAGHMRDFSGRAYLTDQFPAGVAAEAIR